MNDIKKILILSRIQEDIRKIQQNGHWEQLQDAKVSVINLIMELESKFPDNVKEKKKVEINTKKMIYDGSLALKRKAP